MAYDIGPKITLRGAKEFTQEVTNVNNTLKEYKSKLNAIDSEIAVHGASVERLKQKQEALTKVYEAQNKKIEIYNKQLEKLNKTQEEQSKRVNDLKTKRDEAKRKLDELTNSEKASKEQTEKANEEYLAQEKALAKASAQFQATSNKISTLKTGINETKAYVNKLTTEIENNDKALGELQEKMNKRGVGAFFDEATEKSKKLSANLDTASKKMEKAGKAVSKASAVIAGAGTASYKAWQEVDESMDTVAKGTGATGKELEKLQKIAKEVYTSMPVDIQETGTAVADINTRFNFTGKLLKKSTKDFLKFAEVNNTDVSSAIALVSRSMGDASIPASEYSEVLDALTASSQASGISIETLATNLTKYGAPMRALGFTNKESIAMFASWEKAGVNTEIAFSGMKKAISNFASEGKDARVEFKRTLEEIKACPDIASATTKAIEVFGTKAGPDLADAIKEGRFSYEDMLAVVENSKGQLAASYKETLDPMDEVKSLMNEIKEVGASLFDQIQIAMVPVMKDVTKYLKQAIKWFNGLDDETKQIIVKIGMIIAVAGPLLLLISKLMSGLSGLFGLFSTNPALIGIMAVIAAVVLLYTKCEWFRDGVNAIFGQLVEYAGQVFNDIKGFLDKHKEEFSVLWNFLSVLFTNVINGFILLVGGIISWSQMLYNLLKPILEVLFTFIIQGVSGLILLIELILKGIYNLVFIWIPQTVGFVLNWFARLPGNIWQFLVDVVNKIAAWGGNLYNESKRQVKATVNGIKDWFSSLPGSAWNWGKDMIDGFIGGIKRTKDKLFGEVKNVAKGIASFIHFSRPDKGPLRDYETYMPDMIEGMAKSLRESKGLLTNEVAALAKELVLTNKMEYAQAYSMEQKTVVEVPVYLNRKEIARAVTDEVTTTQRGRTVSQGG